VSGPLAQWVVAHHSKLGTSARFVLVVLALQAKHDGADANLTRSQIAERTGLSGSAVDRALRQIRGEHAIGEGPVPGRGRPRQRQVRVWWCVQDCFACELLATFTERKVTASDELSGGKVTAAPAKGHRQRRPQRDDYARARVDRLGAIQPGVQSLARYQAERDRRRV